MVTPVSVNPSSSLGVETNTGSSGGIAEQSFYFGGNPNIASAIGNKWLWAAVIAVALAFMFVRRGRP